jgi:hypothetical protein
VRLVSIVSDNAQHAGQVVYLRGYFEGKRLGTRLTLVRAPIRRKRAAWKGSDNKSGLMGYH